MSCPIRGTTQDTRQRAHPRTPRHAPVVSAPLLKFLYVPAGFPHTTDTVTGMSDGGENDPSVHLTVGVDTHIWGLNYATLRAYALARAGTAVRFVRASFRRRRRRAAAACVQSSHK